MIPPSGYTPWRHIVPLRLLPALACLLAAAEAPPKVAHLEPIPLQEGINRVAHLTPDGHGGVITVAWHERETAWSYRVYVVMVEISDADTTWQVAAVERPSSDGGESDIITDAPHSGEATVQAVRFARGLVNGHRVLLLLNAKRDWTKGVSVYDPVPTTYDVYVLQAAELGVGPTPYYFKRIVHRTLPEKYCEAEVALSQASGLPLPPGFASKDTPTGC